MNMAYRDEREAMSKTFHNERESSLDDCRDDFGTNRIYYHLL